MSKITKKLLWLDQHLEEIFLVLLLILITVVMFVQIVMRFVFKYPLTWPEEFCRYCFVVSVMLATGYCIRTNRMLRVDVVIKLFPPVVTTVLDILSTLLGLVFCAIMIQPAFEMTQTAFKIGQVSPAMEMPVWLLYGSAPLGFVLGTVRSAQSLWSKTRAFMKSSKGGEPK